jgi:hypothetical protein
MPLDRKKGRMRVLSLAISLAVAFLSGCASTPESVITEHKGKVVIVHHRRRTNSGLVDKIEAISPSGLVTQAEVHVYDIGRLLNSSGGMDEAHRYYRVVQSEHWNTNLAPAKHGVSSGPKTVFTPPNYTPPPKDQRVNDAVAEAKRAKEKLEAAVKEVQERLKEDNNLRGELQAQIDENQRLQDQINAGMNTPKHTEGASRQSDAQKAAEAAVDPLVQWGEKQQ